MRQSTSSYSSVNSRRRTLRRSSATSSLSGEWQHRQHSNGSGSCSFAWRLSLILSAALLHTATSFSTTQTTNTRHLRRLAPQPFVTPAPSGTSFTTALGVTWFGGTAEGEVTTNNDDSCELVAVRIERTSANSRRILGEITVPCELDAVWSILTDYNRLAVHVPNLVESRVVSVATPQAQPGDGNYRCRLFQKGAQKIVGFEFGASVTMDMVERIERSYNSNVLPPEGASPPPPARSIQFKCFDSFFFSEFDGQWKAAQQTNPATGLPETILSYVVDVRPKGPVPVAALEWRIREDVPTNLRAVKSAALRSLQPVASPARPKKASPATASESLTAYVDNKEDTRSSSGAQAVPVANSDNGRRGVILTPRQRQEQLAAAQAARRALRQPSISPFAKAATPLPKRNSGRQPTTASSDLPKGTPMAKIRVDWDDNETLGAYLKRP